VKRLGLLALALIAALAIVGGGIFIWGYGQFVRPGPLVSERTLVIPKGSGLDGIAKALAQAGIIGNPTIFKIGVQLRKDGGKLRAGEFAFPAKVSPMEAAEILKTGKTVVRKVTFPEGLTSFQIIEILNQTEGLVGDIALTPGEGALLPETYHFSYGDSRSDLLARMGMKMQEVLEALWAERSENLPFKRPADALTLASIVEKETGQHAERPMVAAVFINRMHKGMRLQSDPTVVYALTEGKGALGRTLTRQDWKVDSPYNTYRIKGLPPAPIANPGLASLQAVFNPAKTDDLYFVADGTGGHVFARTLKEHNRNVAQWRKIKRLQRQ